ncbi:MAG: phage tail tape measure protein [Faecalicatena sp.]|uniref:phage tail tape measure protein n=1 Tax=Faecalicatena sp. TaxID=2005360 RepID=UPI0025908BE8|nr:phage tail tape measure protein [Faecalicatena sp.]MCI6466107.1 phage tail tape measure protein [Faecalicatena sp.]MDY5619270.1 phage tail tape measure protein [Lachnospiraceae bacterium]
MALFFVAEGQVGSVASRIQGITVEIGGDTTKLSTALSKVNKEIRDTQGQLKDVNKLLKLDPGNTELMAQKHRLLAQAVGETMEKLEALKLAGQQANDALARGEISQSQYDALQREIVETEKALEELETQAGKSAVALQKIGETGEKLKSVGSSIEGAGKKLMPVTAAVGGLGAAAVKVTADFDSGMSKVAAVSGAAGEDLDKLREKAREMGAKTKFSASEAASAMEYMAMAGWKTGDMLDGIGGIMNLAAASGEDLATTSDIVTDALTAMGLSASDSGHFADILVAASSNANTNVSMMGETFKYCAPIAGALGFSAEDTAEAIGLMANAGIKSSQAGTAMRSMMTNLTGDVTFVGDAFGELTVQTTNTDGSMRSLGNILKDCRGAFSQMSESEQAANAEALVGKNAMSGFLAVMNAAPGDIEKLNGAITNCDGTAEKMAATMQDNLAGQITILKSQLEELAISIGEMLMPYIRQIVGWVQGLVDWLNGLDEGTKKMIVTIALVAAAVAPVLVVIGKVVGAVGIIMTVVPQIAAAISGVIAFVSGTVIPAIGAVVAAVGWIPIAIAAVIAIIVLLWNKCDWFREAVIAVWEAVKSATITAWNAVGEFLTNLWSGIVETGKAVWDGLASFFTVCWQGIQNMFTAVLTAISTFFSNIWTGIQNVVVTIGTAIQTFLVTAWDAIKMVLTTVLTAIQTVFTTVWNAIKAVVTTVVGAIQSFITAAWNGIKAVVTTVMNAIQSVVSGVWNSVKSVTSSVLNGIKSAVSNVFNNVVSGIRTAMGNVYSAVSDGFNRAVGFITGLASSAFRWGSDLINGIVDGIRSCIGNVVNAVSDVADAIRSYLHFSVPDVGPLTDYETWMPDFMGGLAKGIEKSKGLVQRAVDGVAADMVISPKVSAMEASQMQTASVDSIREMFAGMQDREGMGNICIPVYVGGTLLDEVVVNAQARQNLRSGGR